MRKIPLLLCGKASRLYCLESLHDRRRDVVGGVHKAHHDILGIRRFW
jgi:hypothetical protein